MKKIVLFLFIGGILISCKKEEITPEVEVEPAVVAQAFTPVHLLAEQSALSPNYLYDSYTLDFDGDGQSDIKFGASADNMGNGQLIQELTIAGQNGAEIVFEHIEDSIFDSQTLIYYEASYNRVLDFNENDTITNLLDYSNSAAITYLHIPDGNSSLDSQSEAYYINKTFYIGGRSGNNLVWIKVHVMGFSEMEILDFGYVENQNEIIAGS